jgi:hypothetical protein
MPRRAARSTLWGLAAAACVGCVGQAPFPTASPDPPVGGPVAQPPASPPGPSTADAGADPSVADGGADPSVADGGAAAGSDAGADAGCAPLAERIELLDLAVGPAEVTVGDDWGWATNRPIHLSTTPEGGKIAWSANDGTVHLTPVDGELRRAGADLVVEGESVRGLVAHPGGVSALLVVRGDDMVFVRLGPAGEVLTEVVLVGTQPQEEAGAKFVHFWGHQGRLVHTGAEYAAYFGHNMNWGAQGMHQGDLLWRLDEQGNAHGGWGWGCSHSLDVRLAHSGGQLAAVCLSDAYPEKAFLFNVHTNLRSEPSGGANGYTTARLGGLAVAPDGGYALTVLSQEGRCAAPDPQGECGTQPLARDVGLIRVSAQGAPLWTAWITATAGQHEDASQLARYGEGYLVGWRSPTGYWLAMLSAQGKVVEGPVETSARPAAKDDFHTLPSGDVAWVFSTESSSELTVARVRRCP